jgi:hypothetical protein
MKYDTDSLGWVLLSTLPAALFACAVNVLRSSTVSGAVLLFSAPIALPLVFAASAEPCRKLHELVCALMEEEPLLLTVVFLFLGIWAVSVLEQGAVVSTAVVVLWVWFAAKRGKITGFRGLFPLGFLRREEQDNGEGMTEGDILRDYEEPSGHTGC